MTEFLWGVSTSAYQIEGAVAADGRGPSAWDTFCAQPGRIADGSSGEVACDHYHRYREDVALMADLGVGGYRFSIAWPRVQPTGSGPVNAAGLDFYDRLVDELCGRGIAPVATLYHWDTPQPLEDAGGWLTADTASRFAEYAGLVADRLGDRVRLWITLNEPAILTMLGYGAGVHAPGRTLLMDALPAAHHQLVGHGLAVRALRAAGVAGGIGIANNHTPVLAATADAAGEPSEADVAAATAYDVLHNRLFADPVLLGRYPEGVALGEPEDLAVIAEPIDFYGLNYYQPTRISAPAAHVALPAELAGSSAPLALPFSFAPFPGDVPTTGFGWPVAPDSLVDELAILKQRYGAALPPIYVTENGASYPDVPGADGTVDDTERIAYLERHIAALRAADTDVRGYFVWTLLDNFEWAVGYSQRFGLVHVDFDTGRRTPKASFGWYRDLIAREPAASAPRH